MDLETVVQQAKAAVLKNGWHMPTVLFSGTKQEGLMLLEDFPNEHMEKVKYLYYAGVYAKHKSFVGTLSKVFLVMEAWQGRNINIPPSQDPSRIEVLLVSCLDLATREQHVTCLEYIRDAKGILREIKDMVLPDGQTVAKAKSPLLPAFVAGYTHR